MKKNKGMTLVEMMVAISIFTMGIAGFTLLFSKTWQMNKYAYSMGQADLAASQGLNTLTEYVRKARQGDDGGYPIVSGDKNDLVIYSDYNGDNVTERLHIYYSNGQIKMGIRNPTGTIPKSYASGDQTTIVIASHVVNESGLPIFYYYNSSYPGDQAHNPMATPISIETARLMKIILKINVDPSRKQKDIQMESFVEMRNLNDYDKVQ